MIQKIIGIYQQSGGVFTASPDLFMEKFAKIKGFIFDWDGVFNAGRKSEATHSDFSEVDSMGTNLLRFAMWLKEEKKQAPFAVITGARNRVAYHVAKREHFDSVYYSIKFKIDAAKHFAQTHGLELDEIAFVFDDVLDLNLAAEAGLRFFIKRKANPLFNAYVEEKGFADYIAGREGDKFAVREITELCLGLNGYFETVVQKRMEYHGDYKNYLTERNEKATKFFTTKDDVIVDGEG
ncbi:phosphatase [Flammeovirgaceae bacterium SG7u.111]|nr:phosphatase [Flammeovirgaceae bacterium SG7u.132]WPO37186.1 phosphatase [Flammeovirgaceae bacterium SG7u.111]